MKGKRKLFLAMVAATLLSGVAGAQTRQDWVVMRNRLVDREIAGAGITNERVLRAMRETPRHEFVPLTDRQYSYLDLCLPIGYGQTISPPYIVAFMTEQLDPQPTDKVLEIGTGSGYQAAVLSGLVKEVYTIEIVEPLGRRAARDLKRLKYQNVHAKVGDGYQGWPDRAPFDKIIVTCSPEKVPPALTAQLKEGGRMIIPVGERYQQVFYLLKKVDGELKTEALRPTLFVPMTGAAEDRREVKPDPAHPTIVNGDFEKVLGDPPEPAGWHYQRQAMLVEHDAPSGQRFLMFTNSHPGRPAQALQGLAVDGRVVKNLEISLRIRGKDIRPTQSQVPGVVVTFYDENRAVAGEGTVGAWRGTFGWELQSGRMAVPSKAREAVLRVGLLGATGELSVDAMKLQSTEAK